MGDNSWKEFSGENNWEGILDPLNNNLRHYIIHYGERIQAIYDSIDDDITSETYGFPRHAKEDFFSSIGLETDKPCQMYTVTNYLYAVSDVDSKIDWIVKDRPAWIGYVAVATDEGKNRLQRRDILVSWRGTLLPAEWLKNLEFNQISASDVIGGNHNPYVHKGFHSLYMSSSTDP